MKYVVPLFDGFLFEEKIQPFFCGLKYEIKDKNKPAIVYDKNSNFNYIFDLQIDNDNILKVDYLSDTYIFLLKTLKPCGDIFQINFKGKTYFISLINGIKITEQGKTICWQNVDNLKYDYHEEMQNTLLIYFKGERKYLIALKEGVLQFAGFIDECNLKENEKYFMEKVGDSINHGKVFHIDKNKSEKYLVYLDENDLMLKQEFLPLVFLDCVSAKNFSYACSLMGMEGVNEQAFSFFPEFDNFYPISSDIVVLIKKNTLAGIFKFEINNLRIENIVQIN